MNELKRRTWFITGATRGLGYQIAKSVLIAGENVVATGRSLQKLKSVFTETDNILLLELDICNEEEIQLATQQAINYFGSIDILVNNAGFGQLGLFEEIEQDKIKAQFATNVFGLMSMSRAVLPYMRKQQSGLIFNISSIGGSLGFENASVYCAAKFAVEGFSESLAMEVRQFGIDVTIVQPGFFRTDFLDRSSVQYGTVSIDDYAQYSKALNDAYQSQNQQQLGDPKKLGQLLVELSQKTEQPMRLAVGSDAIEYLSKANQNRQKDLEKWSDYSKTTDIN
ncbi:SDR family NAD(P)-dependent oxidoreductase [Pseudoalteromonas sp. MMG010]|uniref:SDR family NAD(P)-dependent oxidoreductase n=1 Tax=Pseudoalteromonas sp. MMG010 TaxID=2822685 RepID=UPI001B39EE6A|nr:SDR family NAD(P)-dependent oxidoreductase [Pseudoalteromonas sp. MMG010]MBQ4834704.1 SDR family NAD(P)-dependent oxidoreductase [Pseudoalteromonas sp. MMG010]